MQLNKQHQSAYSHNKDFFQKKRIKELGKVNPILLVGLRKVYESSENKKISLKENQIVHESSSRIRSMTWTNYSLTEKKTEDLADRTSTIKNQIEKIINEPTGGAQTDIKSVANDLKKSLISEINDLKSMDVNELINQRYERYRKFY